MSKKGKLIRIIILLVGFLVAAFSYYVYQIMYTANIQVDKDKNYVLLIPKNATFQSVWDSLKQNQVVKDELSFRFLAKYLKYTENVKSGRYIFKKNSSNYKTIIKLRSGDQDPLNLTFNNVRFRKDLVKKIGTKFEFDSTAFEKILMDSLTAQKYGFTNETFMCMFIPNTYDLFWNTTPEKIMDRMKSEYDKFWNDERKNKAKALGLSPVQVSILASIVEEEQARKNEEKPRVAGMYLNRLHNDMLLQADPTVKYAVGDFGLKRVLNQHLAVRNPYNTYLYKGLTPGPIRLADVNSIDAVLNAEKHEYLYMCASPDLNGYHIFSKTYEEHLNNAALYQQALNKLRIYK
jgi:UPF0755 protein